MFDILLPKIGSGTYYHFFGLFLYLSIVFKVEKEESLWYKKKKFYVYIFGLQMCFCFVCFFHHVRRTQTSQLQLIDTMWFIFYFLFFLPTIGRTRTANSNNGPSPPRNCTVCLILPWFSFCCCCFGVFFKHFYSEPFPAEEQGGSHLHKALHIFNHLNNWRRAEGSPKGKHAAGSWITE